MKSKKLSLSALVVAALILSRNLGFAQTADVSRIEAEKAIAESNSIYFSSYVQNDANIFADRYADDCIIMAPNSKSYYGRKGALEFFKQSYVHGPRNGRFITTAIYGDGKEYLTEQGETKIMDEKGKITDDGKYLVLWKKTPAGWKMFRDSFSSNHPPALPLPLLFMRVID
jgi:ketosteroid isomerase-like protein